MAYSQGFPPIAHPNAEVLILGTMPGVKSIVAGQYYANPHNAFWRIMGALFSAGPDRPYEERLDKLQVAKVAVWDVLASCVRIGSLDSAISDAQPNDFDAFFRDHKLLRRVLFNGGKAKLLFKQKVGFARSLEFISLPSTSPAHAARSFESKLDEWRAALGVSGRSDHPTP